MRQSEDEIGPPMQKPRSLPETFLKSGGPTKLGRVDAAQRDNLVKGVLVGKDVRSAALDAVIRSQAIIYAKGLASALGTSEL